MLENEFSSWNNRHNEDAVQNHKHLGELTVDELTDALSDMWDMMDESDYDPAQIDAYLAELEKQEPIFPGFDVNESLSAFKEKHAWLFEQMLPVPLSVTERPVYHHRWRAALTIVIMVFTMMFFSMVTVQAFGIDVFGTIARWTEETFHFSTSTQLPESHHGMSAIVEDEYETLQDALNACGISEPIMPHWLPDGFERDKVTVTPQAGMVRIRASYRTEEENFSIVVRLYDSPEGVDVGIFEKDTEDVILREQSSIMHYIMSNNDRSTVVWIAGEMLMCSISGDLTMDQIEQMINSIYEG